MDVAILAKGATMSDVDTARSIVQEIWQSRAGRNIEACLYDIYAALKRVERRLSPEEITDRPRRWTKRRVRAIWKGEAKRIDNYEMVDLENAALEAAKIEHQESIRRSERLAKFIAETQAAHHREMV